MEPRQVWRDLQSLRYWKQPHDVSEEAAQLIATALKEARADERRKVVEWLREEDAARQGDNWLGWIAGRIEKGEHLKAQEKQG